MVQMVDGQMSFEGSQGTLPVLERIVEEFGLQKKLYTFRPDASWMPTQRTRQRQRLEPSDPASIERGVRQLGRHLAAGSRIMQNPSDPVTLRLDDVTIDLETGQVRACPAGHGPLESTHDPLRCRRMLPMSSGFALSRDRQEAAHTLKHTPAQRRRAERHEAESRPRRDIEGTFRRLKQCTGLGRLGVRGQPAVYKPYAEDFALTVRIPTPIPPPRTPLLPALSLKGDHGGCSSTLSNKFGNRVAPRTP